MGLEVLFSSMLILTPVSSHWLPPSAFSKERSPSPQGTFGEDKSNLLKRSERDIDHCGPDDPVPPNRVNTSEQVSWLNDIDPMTLSDKNGRCDYSDDNVDDTGGPGEGGDGKRRVNSLCDALG